MSRKSLAKIEMRRHDLLSGLNFVANAFTMACCKVSERILNDNIPYV